MRRYCRWGAGRFSPPGAPSPSAVGGLRCHGAPRGASGRPGAPHPLLVVPGGGEFADAVGDYDRRHALRAETAHRMAILAMDQVGWALADLIPGAVRRTDLDAAEG